MDLQTSRLIPLYPNSRMAATQTTSFSHSGVLTTYASSIPQHEKYDKPIRMTTERANNSLQHDATHIAIRWVSQANGDYMVDYEDNGDGEIDEDRYISPQSKPGEGAHKFGSGCHYQRASCDPSNDYAWQESFKKANTDEFVTYTGPFKDGNKIKSKNYAVAPNRVFKTEAESGMKGRWLVRKDTLTKAHDEAKKHEELVGDIILENLVELFAWSYSQEILDRMHLTFQVDNHVCMFGPGELISLEKALQENADKVWRFPTIVRTDGHTRVTYDFYRVKQDVKPGEDGCTLPRFRHYGHRSGEGQAFIQMNAGFGQHTQEDMTIYTALAIAPGSVGSVAGCVCFIKFESTRTTDAGFPDMSDLPKTMSVKTQVDRDCPTIKKHVFEFLRNIKNLPKGWKEVNNEKVIAAPKYGGGQIAPAPAPASPAPAPASPPAYEPGVIVFSKNRSSDEIMFTYTEKNRIHNHDADVCGVASHIAQEIVEKKIDNYRIVWASRNFAKSQAVLAKYLPMFPFMKHITFVNPTTT